MKRVEIRLPDTQYDHLEAFAKSHNISISACIRHILFPPPSDIPYTKKEETDECTD